MSTQPNNLLTLNETDIDRAGTLLARAFHNNPLLVHMSPDEEERKRKSPILFSAFVRFGYLVGKVFTTQNRDGVAVWIPPEATENDPDLIAKAGISELPTALGDETFSRVTTIFGKFEEFRKRDAAVPHWYLTLIGVEPEHQGKGVAGSLLRPMLACADDEGLPCYLETCEPTNVSFYQKYGFDVIVDELDTEIGVHIWTFLRQPGAI